MKIRIPRLSIAAALCGLFMFSQANAVEVTRNVEGKPHPKIVLQRPVKAARAVRGHKVTVQPVQGVSGLELIGLLGNQINALAKYHNLAPAELSSIIERDESLKANKDGVLYYVCPPISGNQASAAAGLGTGVKAAPFPFTQTFKLHSNTGVTKVIYLDFKGHTTTGTAWNTLFGKVVTPPYDIDGNTSSFSNTEQTYIQEIWQRIAEDFAPFDVDVTTEDPGTAGIIKSNSGDQNYGIRACFGGSSYDWLGDGAGGVSFLDVFGSSTDTPVFIFTAQTGSGSKGPAAAGSHELGHSFGLDHQGTDVGATHTEYYAGQGNWAPIMGNGYTKPITQWSKGEYPNASNKEDATAKIAAYVPYRPDQAGDTIALAVDLAGSTFNVSDIIETRTDIDFYHFDAAAGPVNFTVKGASPETNLALKLSLYDGTGKLLLFADPGATFGATLTGSVAQGTYYIAVEGVGMGSVSSTGFTDYASLGQYTLTGTVVGINGQPPIAVATESTPLAGLAPLTVNFSSVGSYDPDGSITSYSWNFGDGTTSTAPNPSHTYNKVGVYTAVLVVTDNNSLTGSTTLNIDAQSINGPSGLHVDTIKLALYKSWIYGYYVKAQVVVKDQDGKLVSGADVSANWSGVGTGTYTATTNSGGTVIIWSDSAFSNRGTITSNGTAKPKTNAEMNRGTFTFSVTDISKDGYPYQPAKNKITSVSVTTP